MLTLIELSLYKGSSGILEIIFWHVSTHWLMQEDGGPMNIPEVKGYYVTTLCPVSFFHAYINLSF